MEQNGKKNNGPEREREREEVTAIWTKLRNKEFRKFHYAQNTIRMVKSRRIG
jgi:hypothetical protein